MPHEVSAGKWRLILPRRDTLVSTTCNEKRQTSITDWPPVVVAAKTTSDASRCSPFPPDPNSPRSTINTVAREITEAGGDALAVKVDTRNYDELQNMVKQTVQRYGRLDVLVYNSGGESILQETRIARYARWASRCNYCVVVECVMLTAVDLEAIWWSSVENTPMKRYKLMLEVK